MYDVITIGSSVVDSFIKSRAFELQHTAAGTYLCQLYGDKIEVDQYVLRTGGGASNTAVGFARMGFRTGVVTELGTDVLSKLIIDDFHTERVSTNFVISEKKEETGGSIILLGSDGGRTILTHRGASAQLDSHDMPEAALKQAKWLHLTSIAGNRETLRTIFSAARSGQTPFSWNPGKKELALLRTSAVALSETTCQMFFVNRQEWQVLAAGQEQVLKNVPIVIITDGKNGGYIYENGVPAHRFYTSQNTAVDDTGAGDAFAVGFVTAYLKKQSLSVCSEWGMRNAASVVSFLGAKQGLLTITQISSHNSNTYQ